MWNGERRGKKRNTKGKEQWQRRAWVSGEGSFRKKGGKWERIVEVMKREKIEIGISDCKTRGKKEEREEMRQ